MDGNPLYWSDFLGLDKDIFSGQVSFGLQFGINAKAGPIGVNLDVNAGSAEQCTCDSKGSVSESYALTGTVGKFTAGAQASRSVQGLPVRGRSSITSMLEGRSFDSQWLFSVSNKNKSKLSSKQCFDDFGEGDVTIGLGAKFFIGLGGKINLSELGRQLGQEAFNLTHPNY